VLRRPPVALVGCHGPSPDCYERGHYRLGAAAGKAEIATQPASRRGTALTIRAVLVMAASAVPSPHGFPAPGPRRQRHRRGRLRRTRPRARSDRCSTRILLRAADRRVIEPLRGPVRRLLELAPGMQHRQQPDHRGDRRAGDRLIKKSCATDRTSSYPSCPRGGDSAWAVGAVVLACAPAHAAAPARPVLFLDNDAVPGALRAAGCGGYQLTVDAPATRCRFCEARAVIALDPPASRCSSTPATTGG